METGETREPASVMSEGRAPSTRFKHLLDLAVNSRVGKGARAVAFAAGLALAAACGADDEGQVQTGEPTSFVPSPTATETIKGEPTWTATVVPEKPTPTETATIPPIEEATTPAAPTQEAATQTAEATSTPTAPATPEIVQPKNYTIEIIPPDPTKPSLQAYEKYSEEEAQQIIELIASKYPILGEVKFRLALGGGMGFAGEDQEGKLVIKVDRTDSGLKDDLLHELVHSWDFVIGKQANEQLLSLREEILSDPQIGRSYPSLEKIFSGNYMIARMDFQYSTKTFDPESFRVLTSGYANIRWENSLGFFDEYLFDESWKEKTMPIDGEDPNYPNRVTYPSFKDFWQAQVGEIGRLAQTNNKWAVVINEIGSDIDKYQRYAYELEPKLQGPDRQAAYEWRTLGQLSKLILAEEVLNGESGVTGLFTPEERKRIDRGLAEARQAADGEKVAEVVSKYMTLTEQGRLPQEFSVVEEFLQAVSSSLE